MNVGNMNYSQANIDRNTCILNKENANKKHFYVILFLDTLYSV